VQPLAGSATMAPPSVGLDADRASARQVRAGDAGGDQRALAVLQVVQREREARVKGVCQDRRAGARPSAGGLSCGADTMCGGAHTDARQPVPTLACKQRPGRFVQVDEEDTLVCVLIDEVESLTAARRAAVAGSEPADAVRAVNAVLTQLDALKRRPNVLVRVSALSPAAHAEGLRMIGEQTGTVNCQKLRVCSQRGGHQAVTWAATTTS